MRLNNRMQRSGHDKVPAPDGHLRVKGGGVRLSSGAPSRMRDVGMTSFLSMIGLRFKRWRSWRLQRPWEQTQPVNTTVDHAGIRGLVTALLVSVRRLLRSRIEGLSLITSSKVARLTGAASVPMTSPACMRFGDELVV